LFVASPLGIEVGERVCNLSGGD